MRELRLRALEAAPGRLVVTLGQDALLDGAKLAALVQRSKGVYRLTPDLKLVARRDGPGSSGRAARRGEEGAAGSRGVRTLLSRAAAFPLRWTSRSTGSGTYTRRRSVPAGDEVVDALLAIP